jgi:hypothetical protein
MEAWALSPVAGRSSMQLLPMAPGIRITWLPLRTAASKAARREYLPSGTQQENPVGGVLGAWEAWEAWDVWEVWRLWDVWDVWEV